MLGVPSRLQEEQAGSSDITQPHCYLPCPSGGSSGGGSAAPGLWSPVQTEQSQCQAGIPMALSLSRTQGGPYPEQQGERLCLARPLCKARLHPVHCKLQDLIQLLP